MLKEKQHKFYDCAKCREIEMHRKYNKWMCKWKKKLESVLEEISRDDDSYTATMGSSLGKYTHLTLNWIIQTHFLLYRFWLELL